MTIEIYPPLSFSLVGQRANNEDTLFPGVGEATEQSRLFLVCDGMGGADKGELASQFVCEELTRYVDDVEPPVLDGWHLEQALAQAHRRLYDYLQNNPLLSRMGTTVALLQFHGQGVTVAHLGDSRVVQIRAGAIIFQTRDHKQVNDLVDAGIITTEQARTHPWRNRLTRAAMAENNRPVQENNWHHAPDVVLITDVQPDDYFLLFSDGVLEQVDEYGLEQVLKTDVADAVKLQLLLQLCEGKTSDNYSGHLIRVRAIMLT